MKNSTNNTNKKFRIGTIVTHLLAVLLGLFLAAGASWLSTLVIVILAFEVGCFAEQRYHLVAKFDRLINADRTNTVRQERISK